jgi:hypothetical protein
MAMMSVCLRAYGRVSVSVLTIVTVLGTPLAPLVASQAPPAAAQAPPAATATPPAVAADGGWPRTYTTKSGAALFIYQPQIESWKDQQQIVLYSAVSYTAKGAKQAILGTIKAESDTRVAVDERLVSFTDFKITQSNFPSAPRDQLRTIVEEINAAMPTDERVIALDRVLANLDTSQIIPRNVDGVKADPPTIFFSQTPAVLINIDGEPIWSPIPENDLRSAVNTNWDLFEHGPTKTYYLRNERAWLKATALQGPWGPAGTLPDSFKKLPEDENWKEVKASLPGQRVNANQVPKVFVSQQPAELILLRGAPSYLTVEGAKQLLWVNNTDSDVFRMGRTGAVYFLVSGRWFSAPDFTGPWTFATPSLPEDFKQISLEHERSRVLASVPGTVQANEAVLLAQIPQTARVSKTVKAPEVVYQGGTPEFKPIETTTVERAVNTDKDILKVGDLYYMCFQGVWFMSRTATGPWEVTGEVPKQIYEIPVSSPSHSVTYVTVVEDDDDDAVVFATAAAYTGVMIAWGCAVWGNGYYYPPYYGFYGGYPYYYPHYPTYGWGASYNPWTGAYTRGAVAYGPYGGAGMAARYNPRTGTYSRGAVAYGPYGSRGAAQAYNPRTGTYGATRQGSNVYGSWGTTGVVRGDDWATTSRYTNNITGNTTRTVRTSDGDVYAGRDGNVYRKEGDGFQKYENGSWSDVQRSDAATQNRATQTQNRTSGSGWDSGTASQVTRDSSARTEGTQRTRDAGQARSSSAPRTATSTYRPSGGGRAGGGGRRR